MQTLESALNGFENILETIDFNLAKTFIDEFLLYLRTIFDISVENSAKLINQFLKILFNSNALNFNTKLLQIKTNMNFVESNGIVLYYLPLIL